MVFFTRPDLSRHIPAWAHFPSRFTRQNAKGLWWGGCPKCHIHNYFRRTLSWYLPTQTPFSCDERNLRTFLPGEYANRANWPTGNSEQPVHNFAENQILTFLWKIGNQEQARTVADPFASIAVSTRSHLVTLVEVTFTTRELIVIVLARIGHSPWGFSGPILQYFLRLLGEIGRQLIGPRSDQVEMTNGTGNLRNLNYWRKKEQSRGWPKFSKRISGKVLFHSISVEPEFSANFGWITHPIHQSCDQN